jgi:putative ABC transport system substrate-binding protein
MLVLLGGAAIAGPHAARTQTADKPNRVGFIAQSAPVPDMVGPVPANHIARSFVNRLRELGYVEGRNLVLEFRSAEGNYERFPEIVAELVDRKVDVIVTTGNEMARSAKAVTSTVPVVMASSIDPVGAGLVASLARPGGNLTGLSSSGPEVDGKRLQLLKEVVPEATRIAFLGLKSEWEGPQGMSLRAVAKLQGVTLIPTEHTTTHFADAFALIRRERPHALFSSKHPTTWSYRQLIIDFAVEQRLPGSYHSREFVEIGGLMSYGTNISDLFSHAAAYVDKILKGAKPADLPVEQPTKFELVLNLKAAKRLGLTFPQALLSFADEVIE